MEGSVFSATKPKSQSSTATNSDENWSDINTDDDDNGLSYFDM